MGCGIYKEKRLHEGGVGPEIRSPAGLAGSIMGGHALCVKPCGERGYIA